MPYIKLENALRIIENVMTGEGIKHKGKAIRKRLKELPIEDVEKVVYCKDCKHLYCCSAVDRIFYCRNYKNGLKGSLVFDDDFCSYGKRKEGAEK